MKQEGVTELTDADLEQVQGGVRRSMPNGRTDVIKAM
jgi:bacteriocin-like protein